MEFLVIVIIVIIVIAMAKNGKSNQIDVSGDPCINQIVQFVRAVYGIDVNDAIASWIDFYSFDNTIVCRFYNYDGSAYLRLINDYSNKRYPNSEEMIKSFNKMFSEKINFSSFPQGTQLEILDASEGTYQLLYTVSPMHQNSIRSYRSEVANAIRQEGIAFSDTDRKANLDPNRIYIF